MSHETPTIWPWGSRETGIGLASDSSFRSKKSLAALKMLPCLANLRSTVKDMSLEEYRCVEMVTVEEKSTR